MYGWYGEDSSKTRSRCGLVPHGEFDDTTTARRAPAATHAWSQRPDYALYLMRRLVDHFDRYLMPLGRAAGST